jgi:hypothetical protein
MRFKDEFERVKNKRPKEVTDDDARLVWAVVMIDGLFGGDQEATNLWLDERENLSLDDLVSDVELACNLR